MRPGDHAVSANANVLPIVGCPAIGSSSPGVKMRIRTCVRRRLRRKNERHSENAISCVMRCISSTERPRRLRKDGELVAFERRVGEDVEVEVSVVAHDGE